MLATAPSPYYCDHCGAPRTHHGPGLCRDCYAERQRARGTPVIVCLNCDLEALNRGRGLCPRCYQFLWRTGTLPAPNLTTPAEVLA